MLLRMRQAVTAFLESEDVQLYMAMALIGAGIGQLQKLAKLKRGDLLALDVELHERRHTLDDLDEIIRRKRSETADVDVDELPNGYPACKHRPSTSVFYRYPCPVCTGTTPPPVFEELQHDADAAAGRVASADDQPNG